MISNCTRTSKKEKSRLNRLSSFDLDPFFLFAEPKGNTCIADVGPEALLQLQQIRCRTIRDHVREGKRTSDLDVIVPCDLPPNVIFTWASECLVRDDILRIFREEGLTGFTTRPARAIVKKAGVPVAVSELMVNGWGGMDPEASGIRGVE